jgi:DNA polymerase III delta subunit
VRSSTISASVPAVISFTRPLAVTMASMWQSRADQVYQTMSKFTRPQLEHAMAVIYAADKNLRDARPDDRVVMEQFILQLVGS